MRVPVVFVFRVLLIALLVSAAPLSSALAAQSPAAAHDAPAAMRCDDLVRYWDDESGVLVVDRQGEIRAGLRTATYRLDDKDGYWLFPPTGASVALISLPEGIRKPFNLSISEVTTADGVAKPCAPFVTSATFRRNSGPPSSDGPSVARLVADSHTIDHAPCDDPFVLPHTIRAIAPDVPPMAAIERISGIVAVAVDLDADGKVLGAKIARSVSPVVNDVSLTAARSSEFVPAFFRCEPVASHYLYTIDFNVR